MRPLKLLIVLGLLSASSAFATPFSNGSFEINNVAPGSYDYAFWTVSASPWLFNGSSGVASNNSAWGGTAANGSYYGFLQSTSQISQTFDAAAGQYTISFDLAQRTNYGGINEQTVNVLFDGLLLSGNALHPIGGNWTTYSFDVIAAHSGAHTLLFEGLFPPQGDTTIFVDDVSVTAGVPVPEPASLSLLAIGLAGLGIGVRKRNTLQRPHSF
jgi:hypothetical protein